MSDEYSGETAAGQQGTIDRSRCIIAPVRIRMINKVVRSQLEIVSDIREFNVWDEESVNRHVNRSDLDRRMSGTPVQISKLVQTLEPFGLQKGT